jgi:hypothetical protein
MMMTTQCTASVVTIDVEEVPAFHDVATSESPALVTVPVPVDGCPHAGAGARLGLPHHTMPDAGHSIGPPAHSAKGQSKQGMEGDGRRR